MKEFPRSVLPCGKWEAAKGRSTARCKDRLYQVTVFDTKPTSIKPRKSHEIRHFSGFSASIQADNQHPYENI